MQLRGHRLFLFTLCVALSELHLSGASYRIYICKRELHSYFINTSSFDLVRGKLDCSPAFYFTITSMVILKSAFSLTYVVSINAALHPRISTGDYLENFPSAIACIYVNCMC